MAIAVRNDENIKGIKISDSETKLLQFADDTTAILADLNSAQALLKLLNDFEKVSGLKLNVMKTEAMWIGSLQNCEDEALGFKWKTCVKCLGIFITYDVKILVEKNFKQRLKKIANLINLWKSRGSVAFLLVGLIFSFLVLMPLAVSSLPTVLSFLLTFSFSPPTSVSLTFLFDLEFFLLSSSSPCQFSICSSAFSVGFLFLGSLRVVFFRLSL